MFVSVLYCIVLYQDLHENLAYEVDAALLLTNIYLSIYLSIYLLLGPLDVGVEFSVLFITFSVNVLQDSQMACKLVETQLNIVHVLPLTPFPDEVDFVPNVLDVNESAGYVTIVLVATEAVPVEYNVTVRTRDVSAESECGLDCVIISPFLT